LTLLGPGIFFFSPPFATGYAFHACRAANARFAARIGLAIAVVELLGLLALIFVGLLEPPTG
jgi:hypothetical protein